MDESNYLYARDLSELHEFIKLVPRDDGCIACTEPECNCAKGEECSFSVPLDCTKCPRPICVAASDSSEGNNDNNGGSSGPNAGAIAGGVIGGLLLLAITAYLLWRFLIKPKRSQMDQSIYESEANQGTYGEKDNASRLTRRSSTHTVHSIASTVLTRASNIIQIAYIPGVTNRATPTNSTLLVPPVPPIPSHHTDGNRDSTQDNEHFFMPGDLRDSTYSGYSAFSDRTSYARTSYAPRSSIASTIYGKQAQVFTPTQGLRAKPTVVSVKSVGNSSGSNTPPVPSIDFERFGANGRPQSGASTFSVGSTFLNNANTATQARAQVVKVGGGLKTIEIGSKSGSNSATSTPPHTPGPSSLRESSSPTIIEDSPAVDQGPFSDPPDRPTPVKTTSSTGLGPVIEVDGEEYDSEREGAHRRVSSKERGSSPFSDEHATRE